MFLTLRRLCSTSSRSAMSFSSSSVSAVRRRIYSRLILRSFISATYSACIWSIPKPTIRFGTTSASSSVPRMISIARSMSSRMRSRPCRRCSFSFFFSSSWYTRRRTHSVRHAVHSSRISATPITRGLPPTRMLKLQEKLSCSVVSRKSFCISFSGSTPRLSSMAIFRPPRSVSSRMSFISRILPALISSAALSIMASVVVV